MAKKSTPFAFLKQLLLHLPKPLKLRLRQLAAWPLDVFDRLRGVDPATMPPRGLVFVIPPNSRASL